MPDPRPSGPIAPAAPERLFVGLGANLDEPLHQMLDAVESLQQQASALGLALEGVSSLYRTRPWQTHGPDFLNAVVCLRGAAEPDVVLRWLQSLERQAGRTRPYRYAPRTLDLDLILHGDRIVRSPELTVPHPRALERAFVLVPLLELAPGWLWPGLQQAPTVPPEGGIERLDEPRWPRQLLGSPR